MIERPWGLIGPGDAREKSGADLQVLAWMTEWMVQLPNDVRIDSAL